MFRGIFDIAWQLKLADQRLLAVVELLLLIEIPIAMESLRFDRHLETRLRMALLRKLPHLTDRYFQSRPVSGMAERSHSLAVIRSVPGLGIHSIKTICDIIFTLTGIMLIDPASSFLAFVVTALAIFLPLLAQPLLNERDLRVRSPIRTHRAVLSVRREHEGLLVEWARSSRSLIQLSLAIEGIQSLICMSFVSLMLFQHFARSGGVTATTYCWCTWALKLPAIGHALIGLAHQYPTTERIAPAVRTAIITRRTWGFKRK